MKKSTTGRSRKQNLSHPLIRAYALLAPGAEGIVTEGEEEWLVGTSGTIRSLDGLSPLADPSTARRSLGPLLRHVTGGGHAALLSLGAASLLWDLPKTSGGLSGGDGEISRIASALLGAVGTAEGVTVEFEAWETRGNRQWDVLAGRPKKIDPLGTPGPRGGSLLTRVRVTSSAVVSLAGERLRHKEGGCRFLLRRSLPLLSQRSQTSRETTLSSLSRSAKPQKGPETLGTLEILIWSPWQPNAPQPHSQLFERLSLWLDARRGLRSAVGVDWDNIPMVGDISRVMGTVGRLTVWVEVPAEGEPLWPLATAAAFRSLSVPSQGEEEGPWEPPGNWEAVVPSGPSEEAVAVAKALAAEKEERRKLVLSHAQANAQWEAQLREEKEKREKAEKLLKKAGREHREREAALQQQLRVAKETLDSKLAEVERLHGTVEGALLDGSRQVEGLGKLVSARNEFFRKKFAEQESLFRSQNNIFKELQSQVSDLLESRILQVQQDRQGGSQRGPRGNGSVPGGIPDDELTLLNRLQTLVLEEGRQLKALRAALPSDAPTLPTLPTLPNVVGGEEELFVQLSREAAGEWEAGEVVKVIFSLLRETLHRLFPLFHLSVRSLQRSHPLLLPWEEVTQNVSQMEEELLKADAVKESIPTAKEAVGLLHALQLIGTYQQSMVEGLQD